MRSNTANIPGQKIEICQYVWFHYVFSIALWFILGHFKTLPFLAYHFRIMAFISKLSGNLREWNFFQKWIIDILNTKLEIFLLDPSTPKLILLKFCIIA